MVARNLHVSLQRLADAADNNEAKLQISKNLEAQFKAAGDEAGKPQLVLWWVGCFFACIFLGYVCTFPPLSGRQIIRSFIDMLLFGHELVNC